MNVIVLHGSPRKHGNSDTLAESFLDGAQVGKDDNVTHFYLNEMDIKACQGCLKCKMSANHRCVIDDDMNAIYAGYAKADIVVWASPMYWGYLTAQLKTALDRMEALAWEQFYNKTFVVFLTYRHHYESAAAFFERIAPYFNIELHTISCCTYDKTSKTDIPILHFSDILNEAHELGRTLSARASKILSERA
ncbi:MAG: flavodoxin family protein [Candidatus Bathyarchaeota archaeon]|nr:flavodoxin family protein [Candidatus Bathyarchaeota archaeon]